jgi:aerobic carbon-monoxide dehydrogenase large subunit
MNEHAHFVGQRRLRKEDGRLLRGQGQYVADIVLPGTLHAALVRSPVAHARIRSVDLSRALVAPQVVYAISAAELVRMLPPAPDRQYLMPSKWRAQVPHKILSPRQPLLVADKVRHVGEPLAVIVAETQHAAEDAAALAILDLEQLPPVLDPESALAGGATLVHESFGTNLIGEFTVGKGDVAAALARAPHRIARRFHHHRYSAMPLECRGVLASHDLRTDTLTVWSSTQMAHVVRAAIATALGIPEARIRCIAPDVGGGFGVKGHVYPEEQLIPFLARKLGRPVSWIEDRREHLLASCHSRDQVHDAEIGFDDEGRILGLRDTFIADAGAWNPIGGGIIYNTVAHLVGPYKIDNLSITARNVATTKSGNAPYRGAGRPEAVQVMERLVDLIANKLDLDPVEVRRRNMIPAAEMPYGVGIPYRDGEPIVYDGGDYPAALELTLDALGGLEVFRRRQSEAWTQNRYLGLGIGCYTEGTGVGPFEGATVRLDPSGKIHVASGASTQGQGMETIFAQITADMWRVTPDEVMISLGDTSMIAMGWGTIASRTTVNLSSAIYFASEKLKQKIFAIAAVLLQTQPDHLELRNGGVGVAGYPGRSVTFVEVSRAARPGWDHVRPEGVEAGLEATHYYEPPTVTWGSGIHAAIVEVDIESGRIVIEKYVVAHDCGVTVNPLLAEAQVVGGTAQGLGGALLEEIVFDRDGNQLTTSLADYLLPTALDVPNITLVHQEFPSPLNPLGVKGLGEGGAISPPVVIANAVCDALRPIGIELNRTPVKAEHIVMAVQIARELMRQKN